MTDGQQIAPTSTSITTITPDHGEKEGWVPHFHAFSHQDPQSWSAHTRVTPCPPESAREHATCETTLLQWGDIGAEVVSRGAGRYGRNILEMGETAGRWSHFIKSIWANSNLFCRDRGKKMDSFSVYLLSQLLSPQQREEEQKRCQDSSGNRGGEAFSFKEQTLKHICFNTYTRNTENNAYARETWGVCSLWLFQQVYLEGAYRFDSLQHEIRKATAAKRRCWPGPTKGILASPPPVVRSTTCQLPWRELNAIFNLEKIEPGKKRLCTRSPSTECCHSRTKGVRLDCN